MWAMLTVVPYLIYGFVNGRANINRPSYHPVAIFNPTTGQYVRGDLPYARDYLSYVGRLALWAVFWLPLFLIDLGVNRDQSKYLRGEWKWL